MTEPEVLDSQDELARLRAENERLRAMVAPGAARRHATSAPWVGGWTAAMVCLLLGRLLLPVWGGRCGRRLGWRPGAADRWVAAHVRALRAAAVVLVIAVYALWTRLVP